MSNGSDLHRLLMNRSTAIRDVPLGMYIHVPYCARRCGYCAFNTYVLDAADSHGIASAHQQFVQGATAEISHASNYLGPDRPPITSVFIGGGTPSLLDASHIAELLTAVNDHFEIGPDFEVTIEANPDGLTDGALAKWRLAGVNRVSFGLQSAVTRVLDLLDRTHAPERAVDAVAEARREGFEHVSLDLIYGTPGESDHDWDRTLDLALSTQADHLSAYALGIEPGTKLAARVRDGRLPAPSMDDAADRYIRTEERLSANGFEWYEISNWARSADAQCRHNRLYWDNHHWWGVGPGAHSHVDGIRWSNVNDPSKWAADSIAQRSTVEDLEVLGSAERRLETIMLGIRTSQGLSISALIEHGLVSQDDADEVIRNGWATDQDGQLVLTITGRLLADSVVQVLAR